MGLFSKAGKKRAAPLQPAQEAGKSPESPYLTQTVVFGMHRDRREGEDSSVFFVDEARHIRKKLVDSKGVIRHFPGIVKEDFWVKAVSKRALRPQIRFRTSFEKRDEGWIMLWQIWPDGRYWADSDGFGMENNEEVTLYTFVDRDGNFTGPFRIYKLGNRGYALDRFHGSHGSAQAAALNALKEGTPRSFIRGDLFPQLWGQPAKYVGDRFYLLRNREEALAYWNDPVLSRDLLILSEALLDCDMAHWCVDSQRVQRCMTLFYLVSRESVFRQVLDKFFDGQLDDDTVKRLEQE